MGNARTVDLDTGDRDTVDPVIEWLIEGDPSIRWQTLRFLVGDRAGAEDARSRIDSEGWGAELLAHQDADGGWAGALYSPKWTSTTYTLLELQDLGLEEHHPATPRGCRLLIDAAPVYDGGGLTLAKTIKLPEACITAMLVKLAVWAGVEDPKVEDAVRWLVARQLPDGGWNCLYPKSTHGSFHTTISVLEALAVLGPGRVPDEVAAAGRQFFLDHRLYRSHRTGEVADPALLRFSFPPRWHFDVLRGLVYFASVHADRDQQLRDGIDLVRRRMGTDGRWPVDRGHPGRLWHTMERGPGPSRWNTLRARRVLAWWDESDQPPGTSLSGRSGGHPAI